MKGFGFSLAPGCFLRQTTDGYYLISHHPVRKLSLNRTLFNLVEFVTNGGELSESAIRRRGQAELLYILFSLTARGYLTLDSIAAIDDFPGVSIIIPVRDQPEELEACLKSLSNLDYPKDRLEIIVVDDGSQKEVARLITASNISIIREPKPLGPAACRNAGAEKAGNEILAFLDADCEAGTDWLKELVPFFQISGVGAVGGYVAGFHHQNLVDRYEAVASSLNMGQRNIIEGKSSSTFYVPTANMLVNRTVFKNTGGFRAGMDVGEDVDFCWRVRDFGFSLLYTPSGKVAHKHRNRLDKLLIRRFEYGTSEASLYKTHPDKKKSLSLPVYAGLSFLAIAVSIILFSPYPLAALPVLFALSLRRATAAIKKFDIELPFPQIIYSVFRSYLSLFYAVYFHLTRYYLLLCTGLGILWHPLWIFSGLALVYASIVDYRVKKPALLYPFFLFFYLSEHVSYQIGVFWGCIKTKYFGSYWLSFKQP